MKEYRLIFKALFICFVLLHPTKMDAKNIGGINYVYNSNTKTATVTYWTDGYGRNSDKKYVGNISIPSTVVIDNEVYNVTSIGEYAFYLCSGLTSVTIPNSVTSIGESAFWNCSGLTSITIPESVTSIGNVAFSHCAGLTSVTIPNSVTSIGYKIFSDCSNLTSVEINSNEILSKNYRYADFDAISSNFGEQVQKYVIGNDVVSIGDYAFYNCSGMTSIVISSSVTAIGRHAFLGCGGLTSVTIPNSVTSIGEKAFEGCGLEKVIVKDLAAWCKVSFYDSFANPLFYSKHLYSDENTEITDLVIPDGVTSIGSSAFYGCTSLTSVTIPNSVTSIGSGTFNGCSSLTSITIPNSVTTIGNGAFNGCTGLTSVTIPNSVTSIGSSSFAGCSGLTSVTIPNSVTEIGSSSFRDCISLTSVTIPSSMTTIDKAVFRNCTGLTSVTIPSSVTSINGEAFCDCSGLSSITIPDGVKSIGSAALRGIGKILVNKGTSALIACWNASYTPSQIGTEESLPAPKLTVTGQTQTSLSYKIENWYDGYEYYYYSNVDKKLSKSAFTDKSLAPNSEGGTVYVRVPGTKSPEYAFSSDAKTLQFNPSIAQTAKTASSFSLKGIYSEGDAVVTKQVLSVGGKSVEGNELSLTGLTPNSSYTAKYVVTIAYGNKQTRDYTKEVKYNTDPLTLTTEQPKVVSLGNVIVSAKANVDDEETNVGFEWRRTDWTDEFKSNTGTANMYEGTMEGYIRNLNTDKLWKFRPYYLANDGTYYYGDWIGLDPTNTSYFEPTVHTYAKIDVTGNTALVKGYALGGTDNITVQGFKYWKAANLARAKYGDRADVTAVTIPANAQTIEAEGRVMEATLSGLDYESTYYYVAFAKTAEGTYYGDVKSFATGVNTTDIQSIENGQLTIDNGVSRRVKGIYTLTGVKVSDDAADVKTLKSGIYIVNGKKVAIK